MNRLSMWHRGWKVAEKCKPKYTSPNRLDETHFAFLSIHHRRGRIHCSLASAEVLEAQWPEMPLCSRGEISVKVRIQNSTLCNCEKSYGTISKGPLSPKGKGKMETYYVNEQGVRPSERVLDPSTRSSVHSIEFFTRPFHQANIDDPDELSRSDVTTEG